VNGSGALLCGDVVGGDAKDASIEERVLEGGVFEVIAGEDCEDIGLGCGLRGILRAHQAAVSDDGGHEGLGNDVGAAFAGESDVFELWVEGYRLRRGKSPGCGGPDDGVKVFYASKRRGDNGGIAGEGVADVDARRGVLLVLDFGFGERGAVVDAPVDRLEAFIDELLLEEVVEGFDDAGFVAEAHGEVGVVPAAEDADALKLAALEVDVLLGVLAAGTADGDGIHLELFAAQLLVDFDLDGKAMAVPAWDVGGVEACHGLGFDDEVLDAFVEGVAEVDRAVGVGRAVVKHVLWLTCTGITDLSI
jgi:hypothetical protein